MRYIAWALAGSMILTSIPVTGVTVSAEEELVLEASDMSEEVMLDVDERNELDDVVGRATELEETESELEKAESEKTQKGVTEVDETDTEIEEWIFEEELLSAEPLETVLKPVGVSSDDKMKAVKSVVIDAAHFPDEEFREYVKEEFDKNGDEILSEDELEKAEYIYACETEWTVKEVVLREYRDHRSGYEQE